MATTYWIANAARIPQITTSTVGGTWLAAETITLTMNGKDLIITVGTPVTTADIAALIVAAWNASTRLNNTTGSANVAGQSIPEFAEVIASASGSVVTFTNRDEKLYGEPFTITKSISSASGTLSSPSNTQTPTRPENFNDADNWSAGAVPSTNDTLVYDRGDIDCIDNLPSNKRFNVKIYNSWGGRLGRPPVNRFNQTKPYAEYRACYLTSDNSGAGTATTFDIGIGDGPGPKLVNLCQTGTTTTVNVNINSRPDETTNGKGSKVVNVIAASGLALNVRKGSVNISDQNSLTASVTAITIAGTDGQASEIDVVSNGNTTTSCTVSQVGGTLAIDWATWSTNGLTQRGGVTYLSTCGCPTAQISNGVLLPLNTQTIGTLTLNKAGALDVSKSAGTVTITNASYYEGCKVVNPNKKITHTNAIATYGSLAAIAANLDYGFNRTLQIAG